MIFWLSSHWRWRDKLQCEMDGLGLVVLYFCRLNKLINALFLRLKHIEFCKRSECRRGGQGRKSWSYRWQTHWKDWTHPNPLALFVMCSGVGVFTALHHWPSSRAPEGRPRPCECSALHRVSVSHSLYHTSLALLLSTPLHSTHSTPFWLTTPSNTAGTVMWTFHTE